MLTTTFNTYNNNYNPAFGANLSKLTAKKLKVLKEQGLSDEKIAQMYNCSENGVRRKRNKLGVEGLPKNLIDYGEYDYHYLKILTEEGNSLSQIAEFYKKGVHTIRQVLVHFDLKTMEATFAAAVKKEELAKLIAAGKTQREIADAFYLEDENTVTHLIKKFGLDTPIHKIDKFLPIDKIADLIFSGMKPEDIAKRCKVDKSSIIQKMKETGFMDVYREMYQPHDISKGEILSLMKRGYSISEIAEMNYVSTEQMVMYMMKNKILKTDLPVKELVKSVEKGLSMKEIADEHELFKSSVPKILKKNNLKTQSQQRQSKTDNISEETLKDAVKVCKSYAELGRRLGISAMSAKNLAKSYGLDIDREFIKFPEVADISKIMKSNPYISIDELAQKLDVETKALERVMNQNNIKIYCPHKIMDFNSFNFAKWIAGLMKHGDSPVQLGELTGISTAKARKIAEKLAEEYKDGKHIVFPKIPTNKPSPGRKSLSHCMEQHSNDFFYTEKNSNDYSPKYTAKDYIKLKTCQRFKVSDTTFEYLMTKHRMEDLFDLYAEKLADNL